MRVRCFRTWENRPSATLHLAPHAKAPISTVFATLTQLGHSAVVRGLVQVEDDRANTMRKTAINVQMQADAHVVSVSSERSEDGDPLRGSRAKAGPGTWTPWAGWSNFRNGLISSVRWSTAFLESPTTSEKPKGLPMDGDAGQGCNLAIQSEQLHDLSPVIQIWAEGCTLGCSHTVWLRFVEQRCMPLERWKLLDLPVRSRAVASPASKVCPHPERRLTW